MNTLRPQTIYFAPCHLCAPNDKTTGIHACKGHDPSTIALPPFVQQPGLGSIAAPLTDERVRQIIRQETPSYLDKLIRELARVECDGLMRAAFAGDKDSYLARWLDARIAEVGTRHFVSRGEYDFLLQATRQFIDSRNAEGAEQPIGDEEDEEEVTLPCFFCDAATTKDNGYCHGCKRIVCEECDTASIDVFLPLIGKGHDPELHRTPAAACDGLESERPASEAVAPPSPQPDRSLSDCPVCKLEVPEAREYARKAITFALADWEWHANPCPALASLRLDARERFAAAKEALKNAPR
jgi:hypothetical protein